MEPTTTGSNPPPETGGAEDQQGSPIDDMISQVDSYIKNPSLVTPDTLMQLKQDLVDLKSGIEGEEQPEDTGNAPPQGSFSGDIHNRMMGGS